MNGTAQDVRVAATLVPSPISRSAKARSPPRPFSHSALMAPCAGISGPWNRPIAQNVAIRKPWPAAAAAGTAHRSAAFPTMLSVRMPLPPYFWANQPDGTCVKM